MSDILRNISLRAEEGPIKIRYSHEDARPLKTIFVSTDFKHPVVIGTGSDGDIPVVMIAMKEEVDAPEDVTTIHLDQYQDWMIQMVHVDKDNVVIHLVRDLYEIDEPMVVSRESFVPPPSPLPENYGDGLGITRKVTKLIERFRRK